MPTDPRTMLARLETERTRLEGRIRGLEAEWRGTPKLFWMAVLAIPAQIFGGPLWAVFVVLLAFALVGTTYYIVGFRRAECRALLADVNDEIDACRRALQRSA